MVGIHELLALAGAVLGMALGALPASRYGVLAGIGGGLAGLLPGFFLGWCLAEAFESLGVAAHRLPMWIRIALVIVASLLGIGGICGVMALIVRTVGAG